MYDNLLKVIRHCGDANKSCADCPAEDCPGYGEWEFAIETLAMQAADAIEDLSKQLEQKKKKPSRPPRRKTCSCGKKKWRQWYHTDTGMWSLQCDNCGKESAPVKHQNQLNAAWNEIADIPKEKEE